MSISNSQSPLLIPHPPHNTTLPTISSPLSPFHRFLVETLHTPNNEENLKRWSSFIGILIAVSGNILISLALNVQKYAHTRLEREALRRRREERLTQPHVPEITTTAPGSGESLSAATPLLQPEKHHRNPYTSSPFWWAGLVLMSVGECGNFLAYGFAPASIISPLGVVALIANCVVAPVMLKEPFRRRDFLGVLVSIAGAVTVVWSAKKEETKLGPEELMHALTQPAFYIYILITLILITLLTFLSRTHGPKSILIDLSLVALYGAYTVLSTKAISSLISSSFYRIFTYPIAYGVLFVLALTAILQVKYVNRALMRFDSTMVIPTQFVLFTISVILGSAVLYGDFKTVDKASMGKFCAGCALTFVGVYLISSKRVKGEVGGEEGEEAGLVGQEEQEGVQEEGLRVPREIRARKVGETDSTASSLSLVHGITGYQLPGVLETGGRRGSSAGQGLGTVVMEYVQGKKKKRKASVGEGSEDEAGAGRRRIG